MIILGNLEIDVLINKFEIISKNSQFLIFLILHLHTTIMHTKMTDNNETRDYCKGVFL